MGTTMANAKRRHGLLIGCGLLLLAGCAPPAEPTAAAPSSTGAEQAPTTPVAPEPVAAEPVAPAPAPSAPATVTVEAAVKGELKPADVKLIDAEGEEAAAGKTGESLSVPSGEYTLLVSIEDPKVLADRPTQRTPITIAPGQNPVERVDFPWASVQLKVRVNGEPENKATVRLMRQGAVIATVESGGEHITLSPGRYQAEVVTRDATIEVKMLLFPEGATQTVPVDVRM
jgi:hypothetical protein